MPVVSRRPASGPAVAVLKARAAAEIALATDTLAGLAGAREASARTMLADGKELLIGRGIALSPLGSGCTPFYADRGGTSKATARLLTS